MNILQYRIEERDFDGYKTEMKLNISLTGDPADFGAYYCISKNEKGITRGAVNVFGKLTNSTIFKLWREIKKKNNPRVYFQFHFLLF